MAANPLLRDFHESLSMRYPKDGASMSTSEWVALNTHLRGRKFSYRGYEFQRAIMDDMHPDLTCIKPSQVGMTEVQIRKFLAFLARHRGTSGIFTLPNEAMYKRVSKTRIRPLVSGEKAFNVLANGEEPSRSMSLYEINGSFAYITGMVEGDATSIPADILFHDEIDLSDQQIIALYQSRLQNSTHRMTQRFSTPTHAGFGVDASYALSDQREYMVKCGCCNHWQVPLFLARFVCLPGFDGDNLMELTEEALETMDVDGSFFRCERCLKPLDLGDPTLREWVAAHPARRSRGYRIRPSATVNLDPAYILGQLIKYRRADNMKGFHNTVLGEPYSDANAKLDEATIRSCMTNNRAPAIGKGVPIGVGIDVGSTCHLVYGPLVNGIPQPAKFELVPSSQIVERIKILCEEQNVVCGAIDHFPFMPTAEAVWAVSGGVIMPTQYRGTDLLNVVVDEDEQAIIAKVNRTHVIDQVVKAIRNRHIVMEGYGQYEQMLVEHLMDMVRIETDEKPATWEKLTGNDHFFHALAFLLASPRIAKIKELKNRSEIRTMIDLFGVGDADVKPTPKLGVLGRIKDSVHAERIY